MTLKNLNFLNIGILHMQQAHIDSQVTYFQLLKTISTIRKLINTISTIKKLINIIIYPFI